MSEAYPEEETRNLSVWCSSYVSFPKYLDPCAGRLFCAENFTNPFKDPCDGTSQIITRGIGGFIIVIGIVFNILSLIAFNRMRMNLDSLFLMKCLAVYDSMYLLGAFLSFGIEYLSWVFGYGYNKQTAYLYVERISYYSLYRIGGTMSFWTVSILTVER